ncbi:MAG: hypothetical protein AAF358_11515 [Pseudomonadota bacterium]
MQQSDNLQMTDLGTKIAMVLLGAVVFAFATMLVLPNAWLLVSGREQVALWHVPFFGVAWGVAGWIPGRKLPRQGLLSGFLAGLLGAFFVATLGLINPIDKTAVIPLAVVLLVGVCLAGTGGWLSGLAAREST